MEKYTLLITEKPDAAYRIATALDASGKPKKTVCQGVPFYEVYNHGQIVVVPALGHLYTIIGKEKGKRDYPIYDYQWVPLYQAQRKASKTRTWLRVIAKLAQDADVFVDACDFDIEGSIIGYSILKYACGGKEKVAKRMKYSTLTTEELLAAYSNLLPNLDFELVEAGLTRHEIDWLYGINLSRALTKAATASSEKYATLSIGRVQGPTLKFLEAREKAIQCFVPTPYWILNAKIDINGMPFEFEYEKILETQQEATVIRDTCKTKDGRIQEIDVKELTQNPPVPFDLTTLQREAYRIFKYTPVWTGKIAQSLYIKTLISYPRTSSQKLPPSIGYKTILKKLSKTHAYIQQTAELIAKPALKPNEGKKFDPAHPAIYPTGNLSEKPLNTAEGNIFDLVVKRFFAVFGDPTILQKVKVAADINGNRFEFNATRTLIGGWLKFYKPYASVKNDKLPALVEGQKISVKRITLNSQFTKPLAHYNPRSLLLKMEKEEIGTKATRATIIQTLHDRKYLSGTDSLTVSNLGFEVVEVLSKNCKMVVLPEMTRKLEQEMESIQKGKQTKATVLQEAIQTLKGALAVLRENEAAVGAQLSLALQKARQQEYTVGICPNCTNGQLVILHSKKTRKRFVGCTNYFQGKCRTAYPLPQTGTIKPLGSFCKSCGTPTIAVYSAGRKPWKLCLNPQCTLKTKGKLSP